MPRFAVVGHVEWVDFLTVPRVPLAGEIVHADKWWSEARGRRRGRGRSAREAGRNGGVLHGPGQRRPRATCKHRGSCAAMESSFEVVVRDRPQRRGVALLDARGERTIVVQGERIVPIGQDDLPWDRLAEMDGIYFTGGDAASLRAARAARTLVATPRARDAITSSDVTLDALVRSAGDPGEQDDPERRGWSARLTVATRGPDGGTYTTRRRPHGLVREPLRPPARSSTPTEPATRSRPGSPWARLWPDVEAAPGAGGALWRGQPHRRGSVRGTSRRRRNWACNGDGLPVGRADRDRAR